MNTRYFTFAIAMSCAVAACAPKKSETAQSAANPSDTNTKTTETTKITFGTDASYAPFESMDTNGNIVGFDVDLAKAMCEEMKAECSFVNQGWDGIIANLQNKKYDVIASSMSVTEERKGQVDFTQKIWDAPLQFLAKAGSSLQNAPEGLVGKQIGVQEGTVLDDYLTKAYSKSKIKRYKTIEDAIKDLTVNRLDVVFSDGAVVTRFLKTDAGKSYAKLGDDIKSSINPEILGDGTAFAVRKGDAQLLKKLNDAFNAVRSNGKYKQIQDKYFDFDVYGS